MTTRRWLALCVLVAPLTAHAGDATTVDWAKGLVIADGVGVADRHAPNPAVARGTSRRAAEQAAKQRLAGAVRDLPVASGGKVADKLADEAVKSRVDRAVDAALSLAAEPETDGAWHVTMAVPIEAVRQAIAGPRTLPADGDTGPAIVVIDGVTAKRAVGYRIGGASAAGPIEGPTLWVTAVPGWAKGARYTKAKRTSPGTIEVEGIEATPSTLFVIVQTP